MRSSPLHSHASISEVIWAARFAWVVTTPLGFPVVPLVYTIIARRLEAMAGSAVAAPARASLLPRKRAPVSAASGASIGADGAADTTMVAAAPRRTEPSSGGGVERARGTTRAPA